MTIFMGTYKSEPIMSIKYENNLDMDCCPPFGLCTAAIMMEKTTLAPTYIHGY